ncbi:MAG: hypothetical protein L3J52_08430 [Proteobacteria bacterium]|nr:hypothetical protein [Pseudomonadota bacterium]
MKYHEKFIKRNMLILTLLVIVTIPAYADEKFEALQKEVDLLKQQLEQVQLILKQYQQETASKKDVEKIAEQLANDVISKDEVNDLRAEVAKAAEWKEPNTLIHMAGYADVGYSSDNDSYSVGTFAPIFHYQYKDMVMLEAELEIEVGADGETEVGLEYLTIDYFLNDNIALVAGKFLSPVGQFRQNIHPSWINKMVSAPPGFGHDGAAPTSELGFQMRGGFKLGNIDTNYALYVSNGPRLISAFEHGEYELEGVNAEGFGFDNDGKKSFGGRWGFLPMTGLEIGLSAATGKATVTSLEIEAETDALNGINLNLTDPGEPNFDLQAEFARDYDVYGIDFGYRRNNFQLRGELVNTKIGSALTGVTASPGATWRSWYTQASYMIGDTKWEPVFRYTDFLSPTESLSQEQIAIGLNYLFTNSFIGKASYEFNDGLSGAKSDENRWLLQLAYGF